MKAFDKIITSTKRAYGKMELKTKQHAPEILITVGVITGVAAVGIAIYESITKTPEVIEESKDTIGKIHEVSETISEDNKEYTDDDRKKDLAIAYTQTAFKFAKVYSVPFILEVISITCIIASHNEMKTRNAALATAYAAIDKTFKDYRKRVVEELGEETDNRFRYNIKAKTIEKTEVNEDGEAITKKETVRKAERSENDVFTAWMECGLPGWDEDPIVTRDYLKNTEDYVNKLFKARGYLTYNDVRDVLGLPRTKLGQEFGWIDDPSDPNRACYISFGIEDKWRNRDFINGFDTDCLLTFNVDGPILDCLKDD